MKTNEDIYITTDFCNDRRLSPDNASGVRDNNTKKLKI